MRHYLALVFAVACGGEGFETTGEAPDGGSPTVVAAVALEGGSAPVEGATHEEEGSAPAPSKPDAQSSLEPDSEAPVEPVDAAPIEVDSGPAAADSGAEEPDAALMCDLSPCASLPCGDVPRCCISDRVCGCDVWENGGCMLVLPQPGF